ncbi:MAG: response regulator [Clostridiales Family XIII bacterium]|jgi:putative two-component system response regulator|nr:response regulator [Clostridiales Family XIII bacterium]
MNKENEGRPTVITIDDDPIILNAVLSTLRQDYSVRPFTSGETALKFLENNMADIVLLDYNMPKMSGFDVLEALQADERLREIPVIFLTGSVNSDDEIKALELGAVDYLLKPFKPKSLQMRVRLQLELFRHRHRLEALVYEKTQEIMQINRKLEMRDRITLDLLARASDLRDHDTGTHIMRTTGYARIIVDDLLKTPKEGYTLTEMQGWDIVESIKLHDIGKIAMPDKVLLKPDRLDEDEIEIIRTHPIHGAEMLRDAVGELDDDSLLRVALDIVYGHHEKWDGSGYPCGKSGMDIPLSARISAISDVFDALTSERPYKKAFSTGEAFDIMYRDSGTHFDPYLIEVVKRHEGEFIAVANKK